MFLTAEEMAKSLGEGRVKIYLDRDNFDRVHSLALPLCKGKDSVYSSIGSTKIEFLIK